MKSSLSDSVLSVTARAFLAALLLGATAHGAEPPPPPAASRELPDVPELTRPQAREPEAEPDAIKVRLNGEYEARQSFLTSLPLVPVAGSPAELGQTSRLFHWLRLRGLALFGSHVELRGAVDLPRGMIYGQE
ncbi:MAG TPA: hypothetical protein VEQ59_01440, partial [Polyangiaceae bacterium]|nr:hypothetical protein [Polyangiaceae bacterium]